MLGRREVEGAVRVRKSDYERLVHTMYAHVMCYSAWTIRTGNR